MSGGKGERRGGPTAGTSLGSMVWAEIRGARRSNEMALS